MVKNCTTREHIVLPQRAAGDYIVSNSAVFPASLRAIQVVSIVFSSFNTKMNFLRHNVFIIEISRGPTKFKV